MLSPNGSAIKISNSAWMTMIRMPSCAEAGVLGVLPGVIGTIQATEAMKLILGIGEPLDRPVPLYDALKMRFRELKLPKDPDCPVCGVRPTITELREIGAASCDAPSRTAATEMTRVAAS